MANKKSRVEMIRDVDRLNTIADEIFDLANSYAGDKTGYIAQSLHSIHNNLLYRRSNIADEIAVHPDNSDFE